ncbi:uncharacterized protein LOC133713102 [Rosa rugosa]|uniref:uncharacterized protein LOC133713102 n=1 Tax=Rosa rugosa TaxID=74645 RepID=UPI002B40EFE5|nr:uncharacterized protein LOC133713102 [Rosa rugosa]
MAEETILTQNSDTSASDHRTPSVVLDIESLAQSSDFCSGSPKMTRALSRKWSYRAERSINTDQEEDTDHEPTKKLLVKVNSQLETLKPPLITSKSLPSTSPTLMGTNLLDTGDGRSKRFNRFMTINPRKILLIFATMSSMGTLILIYFTLAINRTV